MSKEIEIQEILFSFFEDISDSQLVGFIDSFIYQLPADNSNTSKLIERFIEENGLEDAFFYYISQLKNPSLFITSPSKIEIMNIIRASLLSIAFNRLRKIV